MADDGGLILGSHDAARREARAIASELLSAEDKAAEAWCGWRIQVLDDTGDLISEISLTEMAQSRRQ